MRPAPHNRPFLSIGALVPGAALSGAAWAQYPAYPSSQTDPVTGLPIFAQPSPTPDRTKPPYVPYYPMKAVARKDRVSTIFPGSVGFRLSTGIGTAGLESFKQEAEGWEGNAANWASSDPTIIFGGGTPSFLAWGEANPFLIPDRGSSWGFSSAGT